MKAIKLWRVDASSEGGRRVEQLKAVTETETERLLEDILTTTPHAESEASRQAN